MDMTHAHHHECSHHHPNHDNIGRLKIVLALTCIYMIVEALGGFWSNSLALLADAGHMLADVGALGLALFAAWFSEHPSSAQKTYGYYRLEIFAALINGVALAVISLFIFYEAFQRFNHPANVKGMALMGIAAGGLAINLTSAAILFRSGKDNINIRGAFMHVLSDSLGSLGTIIAGALIFFLGFSQADPIFSIVIALLVLINAWKLIGETTNILLEGSPAHLSVADIETALTDLPEIRSVHDLHVWCITSGKEAMSVHIVVDNETHYTPDLVNKIQHVLKHRFGLTHLTVQLETPDFEEDEIHF